ncbi:hypothetical protein LTR56_002342 [Elasticomyces elasticus]|nr:hypothetical protein LTR56_002342 [Elasticomyces elasticus]KAK3665906.1 hypothetical protein LTR22_003225 [Elasticomyces elasticus]KAK4929378.1 hypothetical protein LTR49_003982 [Elasticomyces elasticus]KAK5764667.1 hypothetical protein LTS12_005168 [Elasticomyces elasticus]
MFPARRAFRAAPALSASPLRSYHATRSMAVQINDAIPDVELMENSPGNKVSIAKELKGKGVIIGVPAAFSPSCSESHIPGYINSSKLKDAGQVFVVSVNDAFVMGQWGKSLDPDGKSGVRSFENIAPIFCDVLILPRDTLPGGPSCRANEVSIALLQPLACCRLLPFLRLQGIVFPSRALELDFDGTAIFGQPRSKRYALVVEDGKVKSVHVEPDNTGVKESTADKVLG